MARATTVRLPLDAVACPARSRSMAARMQSAYRAGAAAVAAFAQFGGQPDRVGAALFPPGDEVSGVLVEIFRPGDGLGEQFVRGRRA